MPQIPLNPGEIALNTAPKIELCHQTSFIPQHFLTYDHNLNSVEAVVADITFSDRYPIFASKDTGGLFLQIGIVGPDNYTEGPEKLVYGRRWRVEPNLPTSEIIQTAFLALKKAREHELRECFVFRSGKQITTPFNGHHDLPLMAQQAKRLRCVPTDPRSIEALLECVSFDGVGFTLIEHLHTASGSHILTLSRKNGEPGHFAKGMITPITLITQSLKDNHILYALMETLIAQSDRFVEEQFQYREFTRFSRDIDIIAIGQISAQTRQCPTKLIPDAKQAQRFLDRMKKENYDTDETRIPQLSQSVYARDLLTRLSQFGVGQ